MSEIELRPGSPIRSSGAGERAHGYGPRVHLHEDPWLLALLARLSHGDTHAPLLQQLVRESYSLLFARAAARALPAAAQQTPTRMHPAHGERGVVEGLQVDPGLELVVVDVIRAGVVPAQTVYELASLVLPPANLRLDHLNLARRTGPDGHVVGADLSGSKVGGSVEGRVLLLPDPMGATGSTVATVLEHYRAHHGQPSQVLVLPLVATPEFLRTVLALGDEVEVHAGRLDRGLSAPDVLATPPGARWDEERGLDDNDYVVPGCGGMGEVLNNSWC